MAAMSEALPPVERQASGEIFMAVEEVSMAVKEVSMAAVFMAVGEVLMGAGEATGNRTFHISQRD
jgi:hypothetical protein